MFMTDQAEWERDYLVGVLEGLDGLSPEEQSLVDSMRNKLSRGSPLTEEEEMFLEQMVQGGRLEGYEYSG